MKATEYPRAVAQAASLRTGGGLAFLMCWGSLATDHKAAWSDAYLTGGPIDAPESVAAGANCGSYVTAVYRTPKG